PSVELRDRTRPKQGAVGSDRRLFGRVGVAIVLGELELAIFNSSDHGSGDILTLKLHRHEAVEEGSEVSSGQLVAAGVRSSRLRLRSGLMRGRTRPWLLYSRHRTELEH